MIDAPNLDKVKRNKVAHVKCKSDFLFFTRYFFKSKQKRKFVIGDHHRLIAEKLEAVLRGEITRLIINIAPRYGKTELAVKNFMAHGLALNPSAKFIHLSYSDDLALDNSEEVREVVRSGEFQELYPYVKIKKDSDSKKKWYTEERGGVYATSAAGQVTGFGAGLVDEEEDEDAKHIEEFIEGIEAAGGHLLDVKSKFGGAIIIDDPIKPEDADSDTKRERVNERYDSTIQNRVNSRNTPIIIIMQRVHENDLCGYLIGRDGKKEDGGKWDVLCLPSIKEDGTALWPFKHTIEELRELEKENDIIFQRQHMQNPKPKSGLLFPKDDLHYYDPLTLPEADFNAFFADPANLGGDDFAGILCRLCGFNIYVDQVIYNTNGADENEARCVSVINKERPSYAGIEGVLGWKETVERIRDRVLDTDCEVRSIRPMTQKHTRILAKSGFIRKNFYFRSDYKDYPEYEKFMRVLTSYLKIQQPGLTNKHDDAPDVCQMAAQYFERNFQHLFG